MFSVNTNAGAFSALQNLSGTNQLLDRTQTRINTGLKVASTRDNAAAYSIAQKMRGDIAGLNAAQSSLDRASSEVDIALAGAQAVSDLLITMKEKAVAAKDEGLDASSRSSLNEDFQALKAQITSIVENASFNGKNLLTGDSLSAITTSDGNSANTISTSVTQLTLSSLSLDSADISTVGSGTVNNTAATTGSPLSLSSADELAAFNNYMQANFNSIYTDPSAYYQADGAFIGGSAFTNLLNVSTQMQSDFPGAAVGPNGSYIQIFSGPVYVSGTGASATLTTSATSAGTGGAAAAVDSIDAAISTVNTVMSQLGSTANRLDLQKSFTSTLSDVLTTGVGNLVDADMAKESANLQAFQTKQQLGLQALSIANQQPQTVLSLFR